MFEESFLNTRFFDNSVEQFLQFAALLVGGLLFSGFFAKILSWASYKIFKKFSRENYRKDFNQLLHKPFIYVVIAIFVYLAFSKLNFPDAWQIGPRSEFGLRWLIIAVYKIVLIVLITRLFLKAADFIEYVYHHEESEIVSKDLATFLKNFAKVIINILAFFAILAEAFEVNITAVIASLGIGGLAVALAAQDTLANLIASFIIYLDKPFNVGDLIEFSDIRGRVEKIGFRTTRVRTLDKSLLIVPNKKVIDSNLNNISLSEQRRIRFTIGLTYSSSEESVLNIVNDIKLAIQSHAPVTADELTVRFTDFDASSLSILVIYFVNSNEYDVMVEIKEKVNVQIMQIVKKYGCEFAFPTRTVHLQKV